MPFLVVQDNATNLTPFAIFFFLLTTLALIENRLLLPLDFSGVIGDKSLKSLVLFNYRLKPHICMATNRQTQKTVNTSKISGKLIV